MALISRNKDTGTWIERYGKSFGHAVSGIGYAIKYEHNMIIIFISSILTVVAGVVFKISLAEWLFCIVSIGLVFGCEMINTAIEATIDLVTMDKHPLAKIAKDSASSATLVFSLTSFIGALVIFVPKAIDLVSRM